MNFSIARDFALQLDSQDKLASFKEAFVFSDPSLIYFDGNSLGVMPKAAQEKSRQIVDEQWGSDLIRGWNKGWWEAPDRVGDKIGRLIGAAPGQTIVTDTVSLNLFKLATAALTHQPNKKRIITDTFNFPSDLYILQGIQHLLSDSLRSTQYEILRVAYCVRMAMMTITSTEKQPLIALANTARQRAYVPYSKYRVGAAVRRLPGELRCASLASFPPPHPGGELRLPALGLLNYPKVLGDWVRQEP